MVLLGFVFSLLYLGIAGFLTLTSVHGPNALGVFGPAYALVSLAVLWWRFAVLQSRRPPHALLRFLGTALALGAAAPLLLALAVVQDEWSYRRRAALAERIEITDVADEPLLGAHGNPIGIRLRFTARVPPDRPLVARSLPTVPRRA